MPKYVIERRVPDAGQLSSEDLRSISRQSVHVVHKMGPVIQWISSVITDDILYCTYIADSEALVREHARTAGLPVDRVSIVHTIIDPATAEEM